MMETKSDQQSTIERIPFEDWVEEATERFGEKGRDWCFRCVACDHVQRGQDFIDLGMTPGEAARRVFMSCIGRWNPGTGCDWTLGGALQIHKVVVVGGPLEFSEQQETPVFEFADRESRNIGGGGVMSKTERIEVVFYIALVVLALIIVR